jgi:gliding motility associated protien GldN
MKKPGILFTIFFALLLINESLAQSVYPNVLYPVENTPNRKPVSWTPLREADVMWSKRVWRVIDLREKINLPLYYPDVPTNNLKSLFDVLKEGVETGKLTCFGNALMDDEFQYPMTKAEYEGLIKTWDTLEVQNPTTLEYERVASQRIIESSQVWKYWIKEDWFFDKQRSVMDVRILGICPVVEKISETGEHLGADKPLFWIYFPEARPVFASSDVYMRHNDSERRTLDDVFWKRMFSSYVRKESNVYDRGIYDYKTGLDQLLESERVKDDIFKYEHDLWHF